MLTYVARAVGVVCEEALAGQAERMSLYSNEKRVKARAILE